MLKKLTINVSEEVYLALHRLVGQGNISEFIENAVRPKLGGFKRITPEQAIGCVAYRGPPVSDSDINAAGKRAVARRWAKSRK
jgi:hypothetical protein